MNDFMEYLIKMLKLHSIVHTNKNFLKHVVESLHEQQQMVLQQPVLLVSLILYPDISGFGYMESVSAHP